MIPEKLLHFIEDRLRQGTLRKLTLPDPSWTDFSTNDYLGLARQPLWTQTRESGQPHGSAGSRLLGGNSAEHERLEAELPEYYGSEACLVFNSGYDANLGCLSSIPRKGDWVLYDEYSHASIRDGLALSQARAVKFRHNDMADLRTRVERLKRREDWDPASSLWYVVTESVFSMDGDQPDLVGLLEVCDQLGGWLLLDQAHQWDLHDRQKEPEAWQTHPRLLLRLVTFGKAIGLHGAAVLCEAALKEYLLNFARSFIYTTALPPEQACQLREVHALARSGALEPRVEALRERIAFFRATSADLGLSGRLIAPDSAIQGFLAGDSTRADRLAGTLRNQGYYVRPIWAPTVPAGTERVRICLNSLHTFAALEGLLQTTARFYSE